MERQEIKKIENLAKVKDVSTSGEIYFVRDSKIGVVRCYTDFLGYPASTVHYLLINKYSSS